MPICTFYMVLFWFFKYMTKFGITSNLGVYVGRKSTFEISSRPYLTNDLALRPCSEFYRFNIYIFMFTNEIRPYKRPLQTIANRRAIRTLSRRWVSSMLKPRRFHGTECRFNLPAFFIGRYSIFRSVETDQDLKFGYPFQSF